MRLQLGYVPLTDAAVLIAAVEGGFTRAEGLAVDLVAEPSWATLRDKLALGLLDGAHMLAPLALASHLGLSGPPARLIAPAALARNGNAVALSRALWRALAPASDALADVAGALGRVAEARAAEGRPLTLATVHPFSSHTYQWRHLLERGGSSLAAVRLVVVPPPRTVEALGSGQIDGICVGAPWGSIAVEAGVGRIAALGGAIAPGCPEKVLALSHEMEERAVPLLRALRRAARWCGARQNRAELAALLGAPRHLGVDPALIARGLSGALRLDPEGPLTAVPDHLVLGEAELTPDPAALSWLLDEMAAAGQIAPSAAAREAGRALYRPDLLAAA
ncbi:Bicarbonate transport ATP-binding protein CmpC [Methylobacterium crusticola]|uniref:Bicarbonate transport ATP-binding protein CmpC n=1 Tax=Methylobacterium crusticola TaxID=1697972 RepID=A0ABQ4R4F6_9HYPH|nr:CmpA/NrtA family ABC transporter substrate-binding protein [Methylobacterium crusticola]GJD52349.1 Bicarbonate transport ATP-binding protein CmpC [Methylobacterium crusticola]